MDDDLAEGQRGHTQTCFHCNQSSEQETIVKCLGCNKWLCNNGQHISFSHITYHLAQFNHNKIRFHHSSPPGEVVPECRCGNNNIFDLEFCTPPQTRYIFRCRDKCRDWPLVETTSRWDSVIEGRFLHQQLTSRPLSRFDAEEIVRGWDIVPRKRMPRNAQQAPREMNNNIHIPKIPATFQNSIVYEDIFGQLVRLESRYQRKDLLTVSDLRVRWEVVPHLPHSKATFVASKKKLGDIKFDKGDEVDLSRPGDAKLNTILTGTVTKSELDPSDNVRIEIQFRPYQSLSPFLETFRGIARRSPGRTGIEEHYISESSELDEGKPPKFDLDNNSPTGMDSLDIKVFKAEGTPLQENPELDSFWHNASSWNFKVVAYENGYNACLYRQTTTFKRMQYALHLFATNPKRLDRKLYHTILDPDHTPSVDRANARNRDRNFVSQFSDQRLNKFQKDAVRYALERPLSLIQGPPGTGKTFTAASIICRLAERDNKRILVCAPSNSAVRHLSKCINERGQKAIYIAARSKEDTVPPDDSMSLHRIVQERFMQLLPNHPLSDYLKEKTEQSVLQQAQVICCTCVGAADSRLRQFIFPIVLIDECARATEPESLIPIVNGCEKLILIGDHMQLRPIIKDQRAAKAGLVNSLFERLIGRPNHGSDSHSKVDFITLKRQYRMHPCLSKIPSDIFYGGKLQDDAKTETPTGIDTSFLWPGNGRPMRFWSSRGAEEPSDGTSRLNLFELCKIQKTIARFFAAGIHPDDIGIITPYEAQRKAIKRRMDMLALEEPKYLKVEVASIDAFQGREKDYVILSCVRSTSDRSKNIAFLNDANRTNVALTRAKYGLVVIGNDAVLERTPLWKKIIARFKSQECFIEDESLP